MSYSWLSGLWGLCGRNTRSVSLRKPLKMLMMFVLVESGSLGWARSRGRLREVVGEMVAEDRSRLRRRFLEAEYFGQISRR